ncbi:MAG: nucleotidyltransferase domain-containing protein [Candidatus Cloacimonetes bacterium]|nr:nucleotidyltransferase domain-containing protein [Candidatus Cloacimonadota bacterium]
MIDKAFLYGSYSKKTETENSDIDLMIVSKDFDISNDILVGKIWYLANKINCKIEPYIVSLKRFNSDEFSPLIQLVKQEGIEISDYN